MTGPADPASSPLPPQYHGPRISITAAALRHAAGLAYKIAAIQDALDIPPEDQASLAAQVGDTRLKVPVPWEAAQRYLLDQRGRLKAELQDMGINLMPPDPQEASRYFELI
jgi:hypothetical protein